MTREERLVFLAREIFEITQAEKTVKEDREEVRQEFLKLANQDWRGKEHLLPVKTMEVPQSFFDATGMSKDEFVQSRFPGWNVEHCEMNTATNTIVFVLKRKPDCMPRVVELDEGIRVTKEVAEYTPEIDWQTLKSERPDLFDRLAVPVTSYEVDEDKLQKLLMEEPEEMATLQRHVKVKEPTVKVASRRLKHAK